MRLNDEKVKNVSQSSRARAPLSWASMSGWMMSLTLRRSTVNHFSSLKRGVAKLGSAFSGSNSSMMLSMRMSRSLSPAKTPGQLQVLARITRIADHHSRLESSGLSCHSK